MRHYSIVITSPSVRYRWVNSLRKGTDTARAWMGRKLFRTVKFDWNVVPVTVGSTVISIPVSPGGSGKYLIRLIPIPKVCRFI